MCWNKHIRTQITLYVISNIVNTFFELHCYLFTYFSILFTQQIIPIYQLSVVFIKIEIGFKKEVDLLSFIPLLFLFISYLSNLVLLSSLWLCLSFFFFIYFCFSHLLCCQMFLSLFNVFSFSFILCILLIFFILF